MYRRLAELLSNSYIAAEYVGIEDQVLSKSLSDIFLADHLNHRLTSGGRGSDACDAMGNMYEYKCNTGNRVQCIFNLGANRGLAQNIAHVRDKFSNIAGVYYARLEWGTVEEVAYLPTSAFLPALEAHVEDNVRGGLLAWNLSWDCFLSIPGAEIVRTDSGKAYADVTMPLREAHLEAYALRLDMGLFAKGAHNHVFLAHREGHTIPTGNHQGSDAYDGSGAYEYKISIKGKSNFNFNFGARKTSDENQRLIKDKCSQLASAYCATRSYARLNRIYKIPAERLCELLLERESATSGGQLNLRISIPSLEQFRIFPR